MKLTPTIMRCFMLVLIQWLIGFAHAQDERVIESHISYCINPATPSRIARSVADQKSKANEGCQEWSRIIATAAVLKSLQFQNCGRREESTRGFLKVILNTWNRLGDINPTTHSVYTSPRDFKLRPLRPGESGVNALLVWRDMAALVVEDQHGPGESHSLHRLRVLYPSASTNCGQLKELMADSLAKSLGKPTEYKLLVVHRPRLFWNQWVESLKGDVEQPEITTRGYYQYKIAFSALDFEAFRRGNKEARETVPASDLNDYFPEMGPYRISILPIGEVEPVGKGGAPLLIEIDREVLKRTISSKTLSKATSYSTLAAAHNALQDAEGAAASSLSYRFRPTGPGCAALAVLVWNEIDKSIVTSWVRSLKVVDASADAPFDCGPVVVARRAAPTVPWFDPSIDPKATARIAFINFGNFTIGSFQDLRNSDEEPISWVLRYPLSVGLGEIGSYVDARIANSTFSMTSPSNFLSRNLFSCGEGGPSGDAVSRKCEGDEAIRRLRELADEAPGAKVQVSARDVVTNGTYYIPLHLLEHTTDVLLGSKLRFVQPLPIPPSSTARSAACVQEWSGGLIARESLFDTDKWRVKFLESFANTLKHKVFRDKHELDDLRQSYFHDPKLISPGPEGLLLLAHHGAGQISDLAGRDEAEHIKSQDVIRRFSPGSITIMVACSVGALGDPSKNGSQFLFRLNERRMRAAVISPFRVPVRLAKRFLENLREESSLLKQHTSLYEVLENTKARLRRSEDPEDNHPDLRAAIDIFMVVGDGDAEICKPGGMK